LDESISYDDVVVPTCPSCTQAGENTSILKPDFVFFGESLTSAVKERSFRIVEQSDRLFLVGTTLATYSAFRCAQFSSLDVALLKRVRHQTAETRR